MKIEQITGFELAVIGIAGRFPGAENTEQFWRNLRAGVESIRRFREDEIATSVTGAELRNSNYVPARGTLANVEYFDAEFFGFSARDAEMTDPQQRLFLECAWETCEEGGYDAASYTGRIGVYAGVSTNSYFWTHLYPNWDRLGSPAGLQTLICNEKDFLTSRVSYKLNLQGPSVVVQTACSTSLVAVHLACQALLSGDCDMALAGGVCVAVPQNQGYVYQEGGIHSPDGHCRAFDAMAQGTVGGNGVGLVLLKRLEEAIADGDHIHAVIKGSAVNNDGALKVGYTAPRLEGQARVIRSAIALADVAVESIGYVEAHGTGTSLGDPIEVAALTRAYRMGTERKGFCGIGSVKTNIGHLDAAAGVAGLTKVILALQHGEIPPSLHFRRANPEIDFADTPFFVNGELRKWEQGGTPRRAGVSSFGIGGTNAHVIVEEAPAVKGRVAPVRGWQMLGLSARTEGALEEMKRNLAAHLEKQKGEELADVAYTLQQGRRVFDYRYAAVCRNREEAMRALKGKGGWEQSGRQEGQRQPVVFLFPGQGAQRVNMGLGLYRQERVFREQVDACAELLRAELRVDLREVLYPAEERKAEAEEKLRRTEWAQPAMFVIEYALARQWMSWGIEPQGMLGHSIGEYVAACLGGVFSLEDAVGLVAERGRLMQEMAAGVMLAVGLGEQETREMLQAGVDLAAVNAPGQCVLSGTEEGIRGVEGKLAVRGVSHRRLLTSHAFHSGMMEGAAAGLCDRVEKTQRQASRIPYFSNVSGTWIRADEATDAGYWGKQLRQTVRFADAAEELLQDPGRILLELGPGQGLSTCCRQQSAATPQHTIVTTLGTAQDPDSECANHFQALARIWLAGASLDWTAVHDNKRRRVSLPTYPFQRKRYWIDPPTAKSNPETPDVSHDASGLSHNIGNWFWLPSWRVSQLPPVATGRTKHTFLVIEDTDNFAEEFVARLEHVGHRVIHARPGYQFSKGSDSAYTIDLRNETSYDLLAQSLKSTGSVPDRVVHLSTLMPSGAVHRTTVGRFHSQQYEGFYPLLWLVQSFVRYGISAGIEINVVSNQVHNLSGNERVCPAKATLVGLCNVISQEFSGIRCRLIDVDCARPQSFRRRSLIDQLVKEITDDCCQGMVCYRGGLRWIQSFEKLPLEGELPNPASSVVLRRNGVYLITGGTGRIGLVLAKYLVEALSAKVVLVSRTGIPWNLRNNHGPEPPIREEDRDILMIAADCTDLDEMRFVFSEAENRFGAVHGVIHLAGVAAEELQQSIMDLTTEECERQFSPKIMGALTLARILQDKEMDFCLLFSSLSATLGGLGFGAYSAANCFLNSLAECQNRTAITRWMSVQWDGWNFDAKGNDAMASVEDSGLSTEEGTEALARILEGVTNASQIIVSASDLDTRVLQWLRPTVASSSSVTSDSRPHGRPALRSAFAKPESRTQQVMVDIWEQLLGIEPIGVHDNFFEMGGDSLLGLQLFARIRERFEADLPVPLLYKHPTPAELASALETYLVTLISCMSEEQILRSLNEAR